MENILVYYQIKIKYYKKFKMEIIKQTYNKKLVKILKCHKRQ